MNEREWNIYINLIHIQHVAVDKSIEFLQNTHDDEQLRFELAGSCGDARQSYNTIHTYGKRILELFDFICAISNINARRTFFSI